MSISVNQTDGKSLLALRRVGPESEAGSARFYRSRVTKVGAEVKHGVFLVAGASATRNNEMSTPTVRKRRSAVGFMPTPCRTNGL